MIFDKVPVGTKFLFAEDEDSYRVIKTGKSSTYNAVSIDTGERLSIPLDYDIQYAYLAVLTHKIPIEKA